MLIKLAKFLSELSERIHELDLEILKQKTESKLKMLWKHYNEQNLNFKFPEELSFKDIVENAFIIDESLTELILGLFGSH